jgi:hypothetical protein
MVRDRLRGGSANDQAPGHPWSGWIAAGGGEFFPLRAVPPAGRGPQTRFAHLTFSCLSVYKGRETDLRKKENHFHREEIWCRLLSWIDFSNRSP